MKAFDLRMSKFRKALEVRAKLRRSRGFRKPKICWDEQWDGYIAKQGTCLEKNIQVNGG